MNAPAQPGSEFQPLMDDIFREKVQRARRQSPEERFMVGPDMFEEGVAWMRDGVRMEHPEMSVEEVAAIGITNQRETTVMWDRKTGEPIGNAIVWENRRTSKFCDS